MEQEIKKIKKLYQSATPGDKDYVDRKLKELIGFLTKQDNGGGPITNSDPGDHPPPPPPHH